MLDLPKCSFTRVVVLTIGLCCLNHVGCSTQKGPEQGSSVESFTEKAADAAKQDRSTVSAGTAAEAGTSVSSQSVAVANQAAQSTGRPAVAQPLSVARLQKLLKEKNPTYAGDGVFHKAGGEIIVADLSFRPIRDLSPLKGLPLERLDLRGTRVEDLTPLKGMPLRELYLESTNVSDLSPLKGAPLRVLYLNGTPVKDISPLSDAPLFMLNLTNTQVSDLSPVRKMPLNTLWVGKSNVRDISVLAGKHLESLDVQYTAVSDLKPLAGMISLQRLNIVGSQVTDLTPLAGLHLTRLLFTPSRIRKGLDVVRNMTSLRQLDVEFRQPRMLTPAEFWQKFDAGEFNTSSSEETKTQPTPNKEE